MSNSKACLNMGMFIVDLKEDNKSLGHLYDLLAVDNDLIENADYFSEDTLELGYNCEAERIFSEKTKDVKIESHADYLRVMEDIWGVITEQDFFGVCEYNTLELEDGRMVVAWATGGRSDWD